MKSLSLRSLVALTLAVVVLALGLAPSALATLPPPADFEGNDGNLVVDSTRDWASFKGKVAIGQDLPTGATDNSLGMGSKDDNPTPTVTTGAIPDNKSDLDRFYVVTENVGAFPGKDFLYLGFTRKKTLGTANISIEVNQADQLAPPTSGPWALERLAGDLLFLFDFAQGGKISGVSLKVSKWVTAGNPKTVCQASNTVPCWGKTQTLGSTVAEGAVNLVPITDPLNGDNPLPELTFGEAAVNLTDAKLLPNLCVGFGSAMIRSRASAAFNAELKDFIAPIDVSITRSADPTNANANGRSTGAKVDNATALGSSNPVILPNPPGTPVATSQTGPGGPKMASFSQLNPKVPSDGSVLNADVVRATSTSTVAGSGAKQTSSAEAVDVNILNGTVKADFVRGVAFTEATNRSSGFSSAGSTIKGLTVNGAPVDDVAPNTRVGLPALSLGEGSYVALYELGPGSDPQIPGSGFGTTSQPPLGQTGTYAADLRVTMIRVHITDDNGVLPGGNPAEIIVSQPVAHSEFKGIRCTNQEVSGHAFIASATTDPSVAPALVGYVAIPRSGGAQRQHLEQVSLSGLLTAGTADSSSQGTVSDTSSESNSSALVQNVCVVPGALGCTVSATALKAASHSVANGSTRSSDAGDTTVVAKVQGQPVLAQAPNTTIDLKDLTGLPFGFVILNEQVCDGGADLLKKCALGNHAGLTVRGIRLVITVPDNPLGLKAGATIIVAETHSDATFGS